MDFECNVGTPCENRNRHGNSVFIPDGDSTKPPHVSARIVEGLNLQNYREWTHMRRTINREAPARPK